MIEPRTPKERFQAKDPSARCVRFTDHHGQWIGGWQVMACNGHAWYPRRNSPAEAWRAAWEDHPHV